MSVGSRDVPPAAARVVPPSDAARALPGDAGFWYFIAADSVLFFLLFLQFSLDRSSHERLFDAGRDALVVPIGAANTLLLVTSSLLVALAVQRCHRGDRRVASRFLFAAVGLGLAFTLVKIGEYAHETTAGHTPATTTFFMYYFVITGIHLAHLLIGTAALTVMGVLLRRSEHGGRELVYLECVAAYWHLVDLLWLFIFPLLYLGR